MDGARPAANTQSVSKDVMSLRAMLDWEDLATAWVVLLLHSFPDEDDVEAYVNEMTPPMIRTHKPELHPLDREAGLWVVGIRVLKGLA